MSEKNNFLDCERATMRIFRIGEFVCPPKEEEEKKESEEE